MRPNFIAQVYMISFVAQAHFRDRCFQNNTGILSDWWNTVERVLLGTADSLKPYPFFRKTNIFCDTKALIEVSNRIRVKISGVRFHRVRGFKQYYFGSLPPTSHIYTHVCVYIYIYI